VFAARPDAQDSEGPGTMTERGVRGGAVVDQTDAEARLLVLDDDLGVRETLAAILRYDGYQVRTAGHIRDAAALLHQEPFDIVLADLHVDEADGLDPLQELRGLAPGALVIVLTGFATLESALRALRAGAYAYLTKPTDVEELRLTVTRGLERCHLQRELAARLTELEAANAAVSDFNAQLRAQIASATAALERQVAALDASNRQLKQTQEQHERFVAMVAHELRGPLALVMSYGQLAARPGLPPDSLAKYTGFIIEYAHRLNRLVEDLQTATHLSTGHFDLRLEPCDLVGDVRAAVDQFRTTVPARTFGFSGQSDLGPVDVDRDRVLQALRNLLDNAVKYSVDDGAIEVRVWGDDAHAYISVRDQGAGIPEADLERIMKPFERGAGSSEIPGSGLGLYITRGIVERHGGFLRAENGAGPERARGAIFTLVLPRHAADPAACVRA
jgi:signal transduction histidine kinase